MTFAEMLRGSPLNQQRMADDNAMNLAGMLARGRAGTVRQEPSLMQEIGGAITDYAVPDRYSDAINPSVMNPKLGSLTGVKEDGTPYSMADAPNPVPMLMDTMPMAGITAWHGSPHKFDKFDMSKIGTGEGAQAYGHGLYAAENPSVAKDYQKKLASRDFQNPDGSVFDPFEHLVNRNVRATLQKTDGDVKATIDRANELIKSIPGTQGAEYAQKDIDVLSKLQGLKRSDGNLYKVDIPDDQIAKMLDWDKPFNQQPKHVKEALKKRGWHKTNVMDKKPFTQAGSMYMDKAQQAFGRKGMSKGESREYISNELKEIGIPGIKYFDGDSRGSFAFPNKSNKGTSNFVLFADDIAKILERNDQPIGDLAQELRKK